MTLLITGCQFGHAYSVDNENDLFELRSPWIIFVTVTYQRERTVIMNLHILYPGPYHTLNFYMMRLSQESTRSGVTQWLSISLSSIPRTHFCSHLRVQWGSASQDSFPGRYQAKQNLLLAQNVAESRRAELTSLRSGAQSRQDQAGEYLPHGERRARPGASCPRRPRPLNGEACAEQGDHRNNCMLPVLEKATKATTKNKSSPIFVVEAPVICEDSRNSPIYR